MKDDETHWNISLDLHVIGPITCHLSKLLVVSPNSVIHQSSGRGYKSRYSLVVPLQFLHKFIEVRQQTAAQTHHPGLGSLLHTDIAAFDIGVRFQSVVHSGRVHSGRVPRIPIYRALLIPSWYQLYLYFNRNRAEAPTANNSMSVKNTMSTLAGLVLSRMIRKVLVWNRILPRPSRSQ